METTDLQKIVEIFKSVNDPTITANYHLNQSSVKDNKSEIITITKNLGNPFEYIEFSFPINMDKILVEIRKTEPKATVNDVVEIFAKNPSDAFGKYFNKTDLSEFAKLIKIRKATEKFGM